METNATGATTTVYKGGSAVLGLRSPPHGRRAGSAGDRPIRHGEKGDTLERKMRPN